MRKCGSNSSPPTTRHLTNPEITMATVLAKIKTRFNSYFYSSVRRPLFAWLGSVTLLLVLSTSGVVSFLVHEFEQELWRARLSEEARNASSLIDDVVQQSERILTVAGSATLLDAPERQTLLDLLLATEPSLLEIVSTDAGGAILAASHRDRAVLASLFTLSQSEWFRQAIAGARYHSRVQYTFQDNPYIIVAQAAENEGVVAGRLYMEVLQQMVSELDIGTSGRVYIVDAEGEIIAHADRRLLGSLLTQIPEFAAVQQNQVGDWIGEYTNLADVPVLSSLRRIDATGWYVIVEVLQAEAYAPSRNTLLTTLSVMLLLALAVMGGNGVFMRRSILRPLQRLRASAVRLGSGDLRHRIPNRRRDEIGTITTAFNEMADAIEHRNTEILEKNQALTEEIASHRLTQEQLQQLNLSLEERIVRRTHDLEVLTADLMRSNKELQDFAYIASHDLQEPLRKVRSFGDRLSAHSAAQLDDMSKDYLARMQSAAARMQALIEALLAYSRVTTKAQPATPVDLRVTAAEVISDLETQIEQQQGIVTLGNLDVVPADPLQMHQLLQNLIGNALKFHRPETAPAVHVAGRWLNASEAERIAGVQFGPNAGVYELSVTDNGIGIDPQYFERIFQMFQRLHGRNEYEGTGVGLAICRKIVERHNGAIVVHSQPEEGTSFVVLWPVAERPDEQSLPDQAEREWIR